MHLTNNIPDYIETNSFRLLGVALLLIIISFIVALVQVILQSKKNLRLQKQYAEDMQRFTKLSKEKQSAETAPKDPVVSPAHPVLFGVCAFFILCGFTLALFPLPMNHRIW